MFCEPVIGEKFFGREEVLELLAKRVSALKDGYRQNIAFTGQSLAGKTSILHHFLYTIKDDEYIALYIEIVKEPFKSFASRFMATLLYNCLIKLGYDVDATLDSVLEKTQKVLPKTNLSIKFVNSAIEKGELDNAYSELLGLTSVLKEETGIPCIVILDEFDNLENLGIKNPFLNFGKVIMVQKDTMYIVTSSRNQAIKKILSEKLSLLFGNFEIVKISGFDLKTSSDFINTRLEEYELDEPLRRFLIAFCDGNPFYLHQLISRAKAIASCAMSNYIDKKIMARAMIDQIYNSTGIIHQYLTNFILELIDSKCRDCYVAILCAIAGGRNKQQEISRSIRMKPGEISKGLLRLVELGFIAKNGIFYKIEDPLLEFWLKHVHQKRKDIVVDNIFAKTQIFEQETDLYISNFLTELNGNTTSKITELFNRFSNELVSINSKQIRLPHFTKVEARASQESARSFIAATFRGKSWIAQPFESEVLENDILDYMRSIKTSSYNISNKIIIPLKGIDENAKLLAKELKIAIWDSSTINTLLNLYGKKKMVTL